VLDMDNMVRREVADTVLQIIHRHIANDMYKDEEVGSDRTYPPPTAYSRWRRRLRR